MCDTFPRDTIVPVKNTRVREMQSFEERIRVPIHVTEQMVPSHTDRVAHLCRGMHWICLRHVRTPRPDAYGSTSPERIPYRQARKRGFQPLDWHAVLCPLDLRRDFRVAGRILHRSAGPAEHPPLDDSVVFFFPVLHALFSIPFPLLDFPLHY